MPVILKGMDKEEEIEKRKYIDSCKAEKRNLEAGERVLKIETRATAEVVLAK